MKNEKIRIVLVEDEEFDVHRVKNTLSPFKEKIEIVDIASTGNTALKILTDHGPVDVVILDYQISGGLYGEELIKEIKKVDETIQVIVITKMTMNQPDLSLANQLIGSGAYWFGTKNPSDIEDFIYQPTDFFLAISNAYEKRKLEKDKKQLQSERDNSQKKLDDKIQTIIDERPFIGRSHEIQHVKELIEKFAATNANVLITGESGTGKELVARNIHYGSNRKYENFITVNCSAIPENLIESELFGYEKGAFTDAKGKKLGLFEQADNGTIFLDEISEIPLTAQAKLLRVLELGELDKIGRKKKYTVDVRVIAATNKNLEELIRKNLFREDLFYRLNILNIQIPPLRKRREDIPELLDHYLKYYCMDFGIKPPDFDNKAKEYLVNFDWPGNVRQLKNAVQRMVLVGSAGIDMNVVETYLGSNKKSEISNFLLPTSKESETVVPLRDAEREFRLKYCTHVRENSKNDSEAAAKLGLAPSNFYRLCKELGLK